MALRAYPGTRIGVAGGGAQRRPRVSLPGGSLRSTPGTHCSCVRFWDRLLVFAKATDDLRLEEMLPNR